MFVLAFQDLWTLKLQIIESKFTEGKYEIKHFRSFYKPYDASQDNKRKMIYIKSKQLFID